MPYRFLVNPLYWPLWSIIGLLWLASHLPYQIQLACGRLLGRSFYYLPTQLKRIAQINIKLCFPEYTRSERQKLLLKNFENMGMGIFETAMAWWQPDSALEKRLHISGIEHGEAALARGKGIILLSPHFICLEMIGRLIAMKYAFTALYRPHKKKWLAYLLARCRRRQQVTYIPSHRMHVLTSALQQNKAVWYAYDIDGGKKRSVFAPFFKVPASSLTAISRLARLTGASVIPIQFYRRDDNSGYEIYLAPALEDFPSQNPIQDATRLNQCLEDAIRKKPEQYIWQYKRFKTRPTGEQRFYDQSSATDE